MIRLLLLPLTLFFTSCATHTQTRSYQAQQFNTATLQNLVRLLSASTQQQETLIVVGPTPFTWSSPTSTPTATNDTQHDTTKIIRHASTTTSIQDTTRQTIATTSRTTATTETKSTTNRQPATPSEKIAGRVYIIIALLILCTIIVWFLRRNLRI